jgi:O-succinylbenzoate synthase
MIRVHEVTLREVRLPLKEAFAISSGTEATRRILLAELRDDDGIAGWAECAAGAAPNYSPETIDTAWLAIKEWVAPRILSRSFAHPLDVHAALERDFRGHRMAKATLEMGVWSMAAQREGVSLARLLGGTRDRVEVGISLGLEPDPDRLVEKARAALRQGYRKIKVKIAPGSDVEFIAAVRAALPDAPLMADANSAYTPDDTDRLVRLDEFRLLMIEQPLAWDDLVRHAALQRRLRTPLCLDESITGPDRADDMIVLGAARIVNIKPGRVGGLAPALAIHDLCARHGVPVWCGGMLESGVGRSYNVALASLPNFRLPGDISPSARYWERDIVTPEWTMDDSGTIAVPHDRPGLGVTVDAGRVDDLTVRLETLRAAPRRSR